MLTTKEAIAARRSVRRYKPDPVADEIVLELIDAARLAPSGSNAQPCRFKIVKEPAVRAQLAEAAHRQRFLAAAPVVLVCCVDLQGYIDGSLSTIEDMHRAGALSDEMLLTMRERTAALQRIPRGEMGARIALNMGIAAEHIALRALDFGLGTCWVRAFDEKQVQALFGWGDNLHVVALMPVGHPDESPPARRRRPLQDLLL